MPSYPTFDRNPLDLADEAAAAGRPVAEHVVDQLQSGDLRFAAEDPDAPENFPRVLAIWRANLLGSSGKGNEYFLKHLLGTDSSLRAGRGAPRASGRRRSRWHDEAPEGKLDLLLTLDFRQTSTTIFSDVVLPAATWYEKHDLNTTDMHPFIHSFNPAIAPPWQTRTDWDAWQTIATKFSELAAGRLDTRTDVVAVPLLHDTPDAMANPHGVVRGLEARRVRAGPRRDHAQDRRGRARLRRRRRADAGAGPAAGEARHHHQGRHLRRHDGGRLPARQERRRPRRCRPTGAPRWCATSTPARRSWRCPARPTATSPPRASRPWRSAPARCCTTSPPSTRASRSPSPTPRPRRCR